MKKSNKPKTRPGPSAKPPVNLDKLKILYLVLALIPLFLCVSAIIKYAVNIPFQDDYDATLKFLNHWTDAGFGGKVKLLFSQHGEHRLLHSRIIYVLYYGLFGKINFVHITVLANMQMLVIFGLFVNFIRKLLPDQWQIATFVAALCLFDLSNSENINFAMCGLANYGVIMLFMICLHLFLKESKYALAGALALEGLTIFSNGNGAIGCLFIVLCLVAMKERNKAIMAGAVFVVCSAAYFLTLHKAAPAGGAGVVPMKAMTYFVYLFGGHYGFDFVYAHTKEIGLAVLATFAIVAVLSRKVALKREALPLLAICGFMLGSMASIAVFRSNVPNIVQLSHSGRYLIYPHMMAVLLFVFLAASVRQAILRQGLMLGYALLMVHTYHFNYECGMMGFSSQNKKQRFNNYCYGAPTKENDAIARKTEEEACRKGIYCIQDER